MILKKLDILSPPITLFYNDYESHSSIISGILTIFYYLILIGFAGYFSLDIIKKRNPKIFYINSFKEEAGTFTINSSSFFHFINIEEKGRFYKNIGFDFTKFRAIGFQTNFERYLYSKSASHFDHWLYGKCNNEKYTKNITNVSNYDFFGNSACISKYYSHDLKKYYNVEDPNFKWPIIAHGTYNKNNTFYSIMIERCKNDILNLALGEEYKCGNNEEFEDFLNVEIPKTFNLYFSDNYINILDYKNPYSNFFNRIENSIENNKYSINYLNFNPSTVITNDGLFSDNNNENISYIFDRKDEYLKDQEGYEIYMGYYFYLKNMNNLYERSYEKIMDVISNIGGVNDIINIIFFYINVFISEYKSLLDMKLILDSSINIENSQNKNSNIKKRMEDLKREHSFDINENKNTAYRYKFISTNLEDKKEKNFIPTNISKKIVYNEEGDIDKFKNVKEINASKLRPIKINKNEGNQLFEVTRDINTKSELYPAKITSESEDKNFKENINKDKDKDNFKNTKNLKFYFCHYILFKITFEQKSKVVNIYDDFRKKILSEEHLVKNYLNTYNLLEVTKKNKNLEETLFTT